jgi:hypothetical protein
MFLGISRFYFLSRKKRMNTYFLSLFEEPRKRTTFLECQRSSWTSGSFTCFHKGKKKISVQRKVYEFGFKSCPLVLRCTIGDDGLSWVLLDPKMMRCEFRNLGDVFHFSWVFKKKNLMMRLNENIFLNFQPQLKTNLIF